MDSCVNQSIEAPNARNPKAMMAPNGVFSDDAAPVDAPALAPPVLLLLVPPVVLRLALGYGNVLFVLVSRYRSVVGVFTQAPMGLSCEQSSE